MGNTTSSQTPSYSEKYSAASDERRTASSSAAADLLAQLSLREGRPSRAAPGITTDNLSAWEDAFASNPKHRLASTVLSKGSLTETLVRREAQREDKQVFNVKLSSEGNPVTNQKSSGRCWLFASTNLLRIMLARKLDLEDFQLSQSYLFFYDSVHKANWFLEQMLELADSPLDDRTVQYLMTQPENDGGQWDMLVNLFATVGLVPQSVYPESFNSSNTSKLDALLTTKLREFSLELRELHDAALRSLDESASAKSHVEKKALAVQAARKRKEEQMSEVYRILAIALGQPPKPTDSFVWEYYSKKDKKYHRVETTPLDFYRKHIGIDLGRAFSLVNDPRHEFETVMTVSRLGNVWGGRPVKYLNCDASVLKQTAIKLLQADTPVWFGCDVGKCSSSALGIMDTALYDLDEGFGVSLKMTKAQRLETGDSAMTHAMLITAVHLDDAGKPVRWRVENSWGADACDKGYMLMSDDWFTQYVYQVCADRRFIDRRLVDLFDHAEPVVLPPWDPMGTLA
ncbi:C1 family peptidase [Rhodotorula paludigena]|uniref:C1 family peptidase n=1 Tax=Rhodotorula paludigena TaxID=86838 RepID=UPI003176FF7F